jgi:hypothetical protein
VPRRRGKKPPAELTMSAHEREADIPAKAS